LRDPRRVSEELTVPEFVAPGVFVEEIPDSTHPIAGVPTSIAAFVGTAPSGPLDAPLRVKSFAQFQTEYGGLSAQHPLGDAVRHFFLNGGTDAWIARVAPQGEALTDADVSANALRAQQRGLWLLDQAASFNILCIPPLTRDADVGRVTWDAAAAYARQRGAIVIVDPPAAWRTTGDVQAGIDTLATRDNCAFVCFPRVRAADATGQVVDHAPCGAIAGLMARTDQQRGVWHAAAGAQALIVGTQGLSVALSAQEIGALAPLGVNALRQLPGGGAPVAWGARMFVQAPVVYAPVRRLQFFIEQSLAGSIGWVTFEPNDEPLWAKVRTSVEAFMLDLFVKGAFAGSKPEEAFIVKCDRTTMSQNDIDNGRLILQVGFAPLRPAEFVIIRVGQFTASTSSS
jgi:phage tail sheath protein FI